jgi:hypothetical protein
MDVVGEGTACICPNLPGTSKIAIFYQSAVVNPCSEIPAPDVRQLIHIVARMPLISEYINTFAGKTASTDINCERLKKKASDKGSS